MVHAVGDATNGNVTNGKATNGNVTNGGATNGNVANGNVTNGNVTNGGATSSASNSSLASPNSPSSPHEVHFSMRKTEAYHGEPVLLSGGPLASSDEGTPPGTPPGTPQGMPSLTAPSPFSVGAPPRPPSLGGGLAALHVSRERSVEWARADSAALLGRDVRMRAALLQPPPSPAPAKATARRVRARLLESQWSAASEGGGNLDYLISDDEIIEMCAFCVRKKVRLLTRPSLSPRVCHVTPFFPICETPPPFCVALDGLEPRLRACAV